MGTRLAVASSLHISKQQNNGEKRVLVYSVAENPPDRVLLRCSLLQSTPRFFGQRDESKFEQGAEQPCPTRVATRNSSPQSGFPLWSRSHLLPAWEEAKAPSFSEAF